MNENSKTASQAGSAAAAGLRTEREAPGRDPILKRGNVLEGLERTREEDPFAFTPEAAKTAEGCFFLSFGRTGAGKTTVHYHLLRYFAQRPDFDGEEVVGQDIPDGQRAAQSQLLNNWRTRWNDGDFPESTHVADDIRAIRYSIRPTIGNGKRLEVTFLEVAGELLSEVITDEPDQRAKIPEALRALLENPSVKLIIAFVVSPTDFAQEHGGKPPDTLFPAFLNYLRGNFPNRTQTPLMLIINDPSRVWPIAEKKNLLQGASDWTPDVIERVLTNVMPGFRKQFKSWPSRHKRVTLFRVGNVEERVENDEHVRIIKNPLNFRHAAVVARFIYETFTGMRIRHSLWRRTLMALKVVR